MKTNGELFEKYLNEALSNLILAKNILKVTKVNSSSLSKTIERIEDMKSSIDGLGNPSDEMGDWSRQPLHTIV